MYCTRQDIEGRISAVALQDWADLDGDGSEDAGVVERAIASADALIDSYLGVRYPVPVAPVPPVLTRMAVALAVWSLATGKGFDVESADKSLKLDQEAALAWLKDIGRGQATLPAAAATPSAPTSPPLGMAVRTRPPVLLPKLRGFGDG